MKIAVIGAGINGLSTANELQDSGLDVHIYSKDSINKTTSAVSAAFWYPYLVESDSRALEWGRSSYKKFSKLVSNKASGVIARKVISVFQEKKDDPIWKSIVPNFQRVDVSSLPSGYVDGFEFSTFVAEMPIYLPYLFDNFERKGGKFVLKAVERINEFRERYDWVINCSGIGARELANDEEVFPIQGQVLVIPQSDQKEILFDTEGVGYVVPRRDSIVLGGTAEVGKYNQTPSKQVSLETIEKCKILCPNLEITEIKTELVGLRPGRSSVRLEREPGTNVIHNYGQSGAGVTFSDGCAKDVVKIIFQ